MSRRVIVTGAARGLGTSIAGRFATDGWDVALIDVDPSVETTADRLGTAHPDTAVHACVADVADGPAIAACVRQAVATLGGLDALVNDAGVGGPDTNVVDTDPAQFRRVVDVNLVGSFLASREVARILIDQGSGGSIVNIGSILGQRAEAGGAAYCASKAGVALLSQSLALELAPWSIRVNTVAPGNMATDMHWDYVRSLAAQRGIGFDEAREVVRRSVPLGRHGTGDDVAGAVAWLCSDDAAYVTGQTIGVNGGVVLT